MSMRWLSGLSAAALCAVLLAGCAGGGGGTASGGGNNEEVELIQDLDGYEFVVAQGSEYGEAAYPEKGQSDYTDAIIARNERVQKQFNCKIRYEYYDPQTFYDKAHTSIMSGDKFADVMIPCLFAFGQLVFTGDLYDMSAIPQLKMNEDYWDSAFADMATLQGKVYGSNSQMTNWIRESMGVLYNKRLAEEMQLGDLVGMVKDNTWTWDTFKTLVSKSAKDLDNNGQFDENDQWACTSANYDGIVPFFLSSGKKIFRKGEGDRIEYALSDSETLSALVKMKDMFSTPGAMYRPNFDYNKIVKQFVDGKCVFFLNAAFSSGLRDMQDDFGVLPFPRGDYRDSYINTFGHNAPILCIPTTIPDPEKTGLILDALCKESAAERSIYLNEQGTAQLRDTESLEILETYIIPNTYVDIAIPFKTMTMDLYNATDCAIGNPTIMDPKAQSVDLIEAYKDIAQTDINDIFGQS